MEDDKRWTPRHRVLKAATISFGGGAISCTVRNLSVSGASLDVASPIGIPDAIVLEFESIRRQCRVIWRTERRIGVRFGDANDKSNPASVLGGKLRDR